MTVTATNNVMVREAAKLIARVDQDEVIRRRVVQDALQQATGRFWLRRAEQFEAARTRPGDFSGAATVEEVAARDARLTETARACRAKASLLIGGAFDE